MPNEIGIDDENTTKDFTNIKGVHRFRNFQIAHKLSKNLSNPTAMLHVANLPDKFTCKDLKEYLIEENFTVSDVQDCGREGNECTEQNVFEKTLVEVCSPHLYASFDIFCVQIGQLVAAQ